MNYKVKQPLAGLFTFFVMTVGWYANGEEIKSSDGRILEAKIIGATSTSLAVEKGGVAINIPWEKLDKAWAEVVRERLWLSITTDRFTGEKLAQVNGEMILDGDVKISLTSSVVDGSQPSITVMFLRTGSAFKWAECAGSVYTLLDGVKGPQFKAFVDLEIVGDQGVESVIFSMNAQQCEQVLSAQKTEVKIGKWEFVIEEPVMMKLQVLHRWRMRQKEATKVSK